MDWLCMIVAVQEKKLVKQKAIAFDLLMLYVHICVFPACAV